MKKKCLSTRGGFRGGGGRGVCKRPFLRDSTPCRPIGSPLCTVLRYPYLVIGPKNFLKAPCAPRKLTLRGERAPKKNNFLVKFFQKVPKNAFFDQFLKILAAAHKVLPKQGLSALRELGKSLWLI